MNSKIESTELDILVNPKQADFLEAICDFDETGVKTAALVGGRGGGKSVTLADTLKICAEELPRAKFQWAVPTVTAAKRSLTSGLKASWEKRWNCKSFDPKTGEGEYSLWRKPEGDFDLPYEQPDIWENCLVFPNGFTIEFCGYKMNPDAHRGRNDDGLVIDEALLFKEEWLKIAIPTVRANPYVFDSGLHWLVGLFSSPPWSADAQWIYKYEKLAKSNPAKYYFTHIKTKDNQMFLPPDYIANLRESLLDIVFMVEVEGHRISKVPRTYYPALVWDKHCDISQWEEEDRPFWDLEKPLEIPIDFNAHFTSCALCQQEARALKVLDTVFVKQTKEDLTMAKTLAAAIVERLEECGHNHKDITLTGDRNGLNKSAGATLNMYEQMAEILEDAGYNVLIAPLNYNPPTDEKFTLMDKVLAERDPEELFLRFNPIYAKPVVISMQLTPVTKDYKKDKSSERSSIAQEQASHLGDLIDYYVIWKTNEAVYSGYGGFDMNFID